MASAATACGESRHHGSGSGTREEPDAGPGACVNDCGLAPCIGGRCGTEPEQIGSGIGVCKMVTDGDTVYWAVCGSSASPEIVAFPADGAAEAETIATVTDGRGWFYAMAVDDEAVYWTIPGVPLPGVEENPGGIGRFVKSDAVAELFIVEGDVWGVALDVENIYWSRSTPFADGTETGAILARTKAGDAMDALAETPAHDLVVDETAIYFEDPASDSIARLDKTGGEPVAVGTVYGILQGLAVADGYVYWSDDAGLFRVSVNGGATEELDDVGGPFTIDAGTLYYQRLHSIVMQRDGEVTSLASIPGSVGGIAVAQGYLYFADFNYGGVYRTPL